MRIRILALRPLQDAGSMVLSVNRVKDANGVFPLNESYS